MKTQYQWCARCDLHVVHTIKKELFHGAGTFERIFFGIGTLGFSEAVVDTICTCTRCGLRTVS